MSCPAIKVNGERCGARVRENGVCGRHRSAAYHATSPRFNRLLEQLRHEVDRCFAEEDRLRQAGIDILEVQRCWSRDGSINLTQPRTREYPERFRAFGAAFDRALELTNQLSREFGPAGSNAAALIRHRNGLPQMYSPANPLIAV